ncbi:MAG: radical SAM family heme chaperone HemW [Kiritimatiellae bacterium]|nr:radical SAM family heme chaperone HemW [Kiritimatiellia bacterium]MDD5520520.1 radical SAM family heme chaperone HemW [Kiritimatiellia bacterium]
MKRAGEHLYFHVPFCDGKCVYCGFYSELYKSPVAVEYIKAIGKELELYFEDVVPVPRTIYFGGGTPSILSEKELERLCRLISEKVSLECLEEWTVEANPGTLSSTKLKILKSAGVNRISLGVQSFDDRILKNMGRRHCASDVVETANVVRESGITNIGFDLIACLPEVDEPMWRRTIEEALKLEPDHLSVYALSVEDGAKLGRLVGEGGLSIAGDDETLNMLDIAETLLDRKGYRRYEISNYARKGCECLHNLSFWRGEDYIGFGASASSRDGTLRRTNKANIDQYMSALFSGIKPPHEEEALPSEADANERFVFAFRLKEGVDLSSFCNKYAVNVDMMEKYWKILKKLAGDNLTEFMDGRWKLTAKGRALADHVAVELMSD